MPRDDKPVLRTVAVIGLTLLALVALRGYLPGAPPPAARRDPDPGGSGSLTAVVAMLVVSIAAIAVSLLARARHPRRPHGAGELPRTAGVGRGRMPWRGLLLAVTALFAWLLLIVFLMRWVSPTDIADPQASPYQQPDSPTAGPARPKSPPEQGDDDVFVLLLAATIALVVLSFAATILGRRRGEQSPPQPADDERPVSPPAGGADLAKATELGLAEIGDLRRDPREAIIACYAAMERQLEKSPSTVPQASDTPSEVLARAVARRVLQADSATELVDLFEEARFSPHVMNEDHRAGAVRALRTVQRDLENAR